MEGGRDVSSDVRACASCHIVQAAGLLAVIGPCRGSNTAVAAAARRPADVLEPAGVAIEHRLLHRVVVVVRALRWRWRFFEGGGELVEVFEEWRWRCGGGGGGGSGLPARRCWCLPRSSPPTTCTCGECEWRQRIARRIARNRAAHHSPLCTTRGCCRRTRAMMSPERQPALAARLQHAAVVRRDVFRVPVDVEALGPRLRTRFLDHVVGGSGRRAR